MENRNDLFSFFLNNLHGTGYAYGRDNFTAVITKRHRDTSGFGRIFPVFCCITPLGNKIQLIQKINKVKDSILCIPSDIYFLEVLENILFTVIQHEKLA